MQILDLGFVKGDKGDKGDQGPQGIGLEIKDSFSVYDEFIAAHPTGVAGDAYIVEGDLYVWDATNEEWDNVGRIVS